MKSTEKSSLSDWRPHGKRKKLQNMTRQKKAHRVLLV